MKLPYKKIIITGGAGFVGSNLGIRLKENYPKAEITALDNLKRRGSELILPKLKKYGIKFIHADIRNKEDLEDISGDLLLECSAEPSCLAGIEKGLNYLINTNFAGAVNCFELAQQLRADLIFLSTSRIYPFEKINKLGFKETKTRVELSSLKNFAGISDKGINENFPLEGARTFYGASKLAAEYLLQEYIHFKRLRGIINRCGIITGPWQMGKIDQGIVTFWLASHIFGRPLKYIGWQGKGKQVRDFIHVDDLYKLVELQLFNFDEHSGNIFNVGGGPKFSFSLLELTNICQKLTGVKVPISSDSKLRTGDVRWYISDISKVSSAFNWFPRVKLEDTAEEIIRWIKENKNYLKDIL